jgi:hypothetical protein
MFELGFAHPEDLLIGGIEGSIIVTRVIIKILRYPFALYELQRVLRMSEFGPLPEVKIFEWASHNLDKKRG